MIDESNETNDGGFASGDMLVSLCDDGLAHGFRVLDDGVMEVPACGSPARELPGEAGEATGKDVVCEGCVKIMAKLLACDPAYVDAAVEAVKERKSRRMAARGRD